MVMISLVILIILLIIVLNIEYFCNDPNYIEMQDSTKKNKICCPKDQDYTVIKGDSGYFCCQHATRTKPINPSGWQKKNGFYCTSIIP